MAELALPTPLAVLEKRNLIKVNPDQNSIRILAVDNHPQFREGIAVVLATQPGMDLVAQACNGHEAIQQFRTHCPDITLMDLQMPGMNGLDAMTAIRREFPGAQIIVLTTFENDFEIQRALEAELAPTF